MSLRTEFADAVRAHPALPKQWGVYAYGFSPGNPRHPLVVIRQTKITRTPQAPKIAQDASFSVALVEPALDPERVEDALDADVETLIEILEALDLPGLLWQEAQRVTFEDRFHGYDITVTITNTKDTP